MSGGIHSAQPVGTGFRAQTDDGGDVPVDVNTPGIGSVEPLAKSSACPLGTKLRWCDWKHDSVRGSDAGQRRYA